MLQFSEDLVDQLMAGFPHDKGQVDLVLNQDRLISSLGHYPEFDEQRGRCVVCFAKGMRHETYAKCCHCGVHYVLVMQETVSRCTTQKVTTFTELWYSACSFEVLKFSSFFLFVFCFLFHSWSIWAFFLPCLAFIYFNRYFISSYVARPPRGA